MVGGYLKPGGPLTDSFEVFSPDGKCNYILSAIPKAIYGVVLALFNGRITACGGSINQVQNLNFKEFSRTACIGFFHLGIIH